MLRNVLFPLILIVLTSAMTIYCWYEDLPFSLFGLIGFFTLALGSMYISYFISYKTFPDKRNKPLPPLIDLTTQAPKKKGQPQAYTKGSIWAMVLTITLTAGGIYGWIQLADRYTSYQLTNHGKPTKAVIIGSGHSKGIGTYREYEYMDDEGKKYTDRFSNTSYAIGDTVIIIYSTARPIINKVITTCLP